MSLRGRIATTAAVAVAVAVVLAFAGLYVVTARTLVGQVDRSLVALVRDVGRGMGGRPGPGGIEGGVRPGAFGGAGGYVRAVGADGRVLGDLGPDRLDLPVTDRVLAVARGDAPQYLATERVDGVAFRVLTAPTRGDAAVQVARPLDEVEATLAALRRRLVLFGLLGIGLAAALGMVVARRAVRPVDRLTDLAEEVAATQDLSRRLDLGGPEHRTDEIGRLAGTFNAMLAALEQARSAQEQLVADASHELRTPLTSLRTNIEVLARGDRLDPEARRALLDDVVLQLDEFGRLVTGLVELARGDRPARGVVPVRLDHLVERVVARARTHGTDGVELVLDARPEHGPRRGGPGRAGGQQPRRQRRQVRRRRRARGGHGRRRDGPGARPRARHRRRGPAPRLRPLLPVGRGPRGARVRARPVHRGPGGRGPRWHRLRRGGTRWRGGGLHGAARRAGRDRGGRRGAAPTPAATRRRARGGRDVPGSRVLVVASPACLTP